jgi:hypothetical protein
MGQKQKEGGPCNDLGGRRWPLGVAVSRGSSGMLGIEPAGFVDGLHIEKYVLLE